MKKVSSMFGTLFLILSIIILIVCVYVAVKSKRTGEEIYIFGYKPYMIATGSMEPTLKVRGIVLVKEVPYEEIKEGDIISFIPTLIGQSVCHRVIEVTPEGFVTKGDNNYTADMSVATKDEYKGKVVFSTNVLGTAYYAITEGNKIIVIGLFILILLGVVMAVVAIKYLRKEE